VKAETNVTRLRAILHDQNTERYQLRVEIERLTELHQRKVNEIRMYEELLERAKDY